MSDNRRAFQRLSLNQPVDGWFGDYPIRLVDVSATGALIEYDDVIPTDSRALLRFFWREDEIELMAEIVRNGDGESGLRFLEQSAGLNRLIADCAAELLRAQLANMSGDRDANRIGEETLTSASMNIKSKSKSHPFLMCVLEPEGWTRHLTMTPEQPENGFTVASAEPSAEIDMLCRTFEAGDAQARHLTRLFAELSVANAR